MQYPKRRHRNVVSHARDLLGETSVEEVKRSQETLGKLSSHDAYLALSEGEREGRKAE